MGWTVGKYEVSAAVGECVASVGELWQGPVATEDGDQIAVIGLHARCFKSTVAFTRSSRATLDSTRASSGAVLRRKAYDQFYSQTRMGPVPGKFTHESNIPVGAGMASSTADAVSTVRCLAGLHNISATNELVQSVLGALERSDPTFIDYHCFYLTEIQEVVNPVPHRYSYYCVWTYEKNKVHRTRDDTARDLLDFYGSVRDEYQRSYDNASVALWSGDRSLLAEAATWSAKRAQDYHFNPGVERALKTYKDIGAYGVVRAHTGTVAGYLFPPDVHRSALDVARDMLSDLGGQILEGEVGLGAIEILDRPTA